MPEQTRHTLLNCPQGPTIANINDTLKRVVDALEKVAATNIRIDHQVEDIKLLRAENENLSSRMREVEMVVGKGGNGFKLEVVQAMDEMKDAIQKEIKQVREEIAPIKKNSDSTVDFVATLKGKKALYVIGTVLGMIVTGTICDLAYHADFFFKLIELGSKFKKAVV